MEFNESKIKNFQPETFETKTKEMLSLKWMMSTVYPCFNNFKMEVFKHSRILNQFYIMSEADELFDMEINELAFFMLTNKMDRYTDRRSQKETVED